MEYDWSSFTKRVNIKASIADIYTMCATPAGLENWFLRLVEFTKPGGELLPENDMINGGQSFRWLWHGWPDSMEQKGDVLKANGTDLVKFTFGQEGAADMVCAFKIYTEQNETIFEIKQENNIPEDERGKCYYHIGCIKGWSFFMVNMKSILENGYDLRNKNENLKNVVTA